MSADNFFAAYLKEKKNADTIVNDHGFITYVHREDHIHIHEVYIKPESRKLGEGRKLINKVEEVAKEKGMKFITTNCALDTENAADSLKAVLAGFKPFKANYTIEFFREVL